MIFTEAGTQREAVGRAAQQQPSNYFPTNRELSQLSACAPCASYVEGLRGTRSYNRRVPPSVSVHPKNTETHCVHFVKLFWDRPATAPATR